MKVNRETSTSGSTTGEPYIGMPIYIAEEEGEYEAMVSAATEPVNVSVNQPKEPAQFEEENPQNYCRDSSFERWSLAIAYVPWQSFGTPNEVEIAFEEGTIFPDLNLPFLGGGRQ